MKKVVYLFVLIMTVILLTACNFIDSKQDKDEKDSGTSENIPSENSSAGEEGQGQERKVSAWIVYWDTDILKELARMDKNIETLCYFAAYYKEDDSLFLPEETADIYSKVKQNYGDTRFKSYLTFVNDIRMNDGTSKLKDTELLYRILGTEESRKAHIADIISLVSKGGYDGIEIDYEAIREDITLWNYFSEFAKELYREAAQKGLPVRILLEPNAPADKVDFPQGPEYVLMCYNLFGYGTEPGPKADKAFLEEMMQKMKAFPKVNFAVATGGFDFEEGGTVKQITEEDAVLRIKECKAEVQRDETSRCLVFPYRDEKGKNHEVWYSDKDTIEYWLQMFHKKGYYNVSIWRLGGNVTVTP